MAQVIGRGRHSLDRGAGLTHPRRGLESRLVMGARIRITVCLVLGAVGCAPARVHAPPDPSAPPSPEVVSGARWRDTRASRTPGPRVGVPGSAEARMAAWVFSSPALRATLDPASLVADWALERALARLGEERFDLPPSFPTPSAWWGDADVLRPEVERWKDSFLKRGGSGVQRWLDEAAPYMPHVRSILLEEGLPPELWVLTLLESGFRPEARSPSAAVGPWQFLAATARHTGLDD